MRIRLACPLLSAAALSAAALPLPAPAETTQCTPINSLPATIGSGCVYCLLHDLSTGASTGAAVTIASNNVTLDCNDRKIGGLAAGDATQAIGISASDRVNITIRNCGIRGFRTGIQLIGDGSGHLVEHNRLDYNTNYGIFLRGGGNTVRANRIFDTGGSTFPGNGYANAINASEDADVIDNTVKGVVATAGSDDSAVGIVANVGTGGEISRNRVSGLVHDGTGDNVGIWANGGRTTVRDNSVAGTTAIGDGVVYGVVCATDLSVARDNVVVGYGQYHSFSGCKFLDNLSSW